MGIREAIRGLRERLQRRGREQPTISELFMQGRLDSSLQPAHEAVLRHLLRGESEINAERDIVPRLERGWKYRSGNTVRIALTELSSAGVLIARADRFSIAPRYVEKVRAHLSEK